MKTEIYNDFEYEVREMDPPSDLYKWYRRIAPSQYPRPQDWKLAGVYLGSLDVVGWVFQRGTWWKWRIKRLSWYDEGLEKTEAKAIAVVERGMK